MDSKTNKVKLLLAEYLKIEVPIPIFKEEPKLPIFFNSIEEGEKMKEEFERVVVYNEKLSARITDAGQKKNQIEKQLLNLFPLNTWFRFNISGKNWFVGFESKAWSSSPPSFIVTSVEPKQPLNKGNLSV